jgi:hypothetical protein
VLVQVTVISRASQSPSSADAEHPPSAKPAIAKDIKRNRFSYRMWISYVVLSPLIGVFCYPVNSMNLLRLLQKQV